MHNIPLFKVFMSEDVLEPVNKVLMSGYVGQGKQVDAFEDSLKKYIGNNNLLTVNSGTSAIHLAIHMLKKDLDPCQNEILTTPLTCTATNFPIISNGLKIKWVDLDRNTCNLDLKDLRRKISTKTAAIMVVHWGGYPVDLDELKDIQEKAKNIYGRNIAIIEDCAHAFGAEYHGQKIGNSGNYCMFSFQAIKHLTTCDGGMLITQEKDYKRAKLLRWYGLDRDSSLDFRCEQNIEECGFKFHMNDVAATIGLHNLPYVDKLIEKHQENASWLHEHLSNVDGIKLLERKEDRKSADWIFTIRVERRAEFMKMMKSANIGVSQVHDRNDKHKCLSEFREPLLATDEICSDMCCVPCGWWVSPDDREYIAESIRKGW